MCILVIKSLLIFCIRELTIKEYFPYTIVLKIFFLLIAPLGEKLNLRKPF